MNNRIFIKAIHPATALPLPPKGEKPFAHCWPEVPSRVYPSGELGVKTTNKTNQHKPEATLGAIPMGKL
jgi:hypothetical protein